MLTRAGAADRNTTLLVVVVLPLRPIRIRYQVPLAICEVVYQRMPGWNLWYDKDGTTGSRYYTYILTAGQGGATAVEWEYHGYKVLVFIPDTECCSYIPGCQV